MTTSYVVHEKGDRFAIHGIFDTLADAQSYITVSVPKLTSQGYFSDRALNVSSFDILERCDEKGEQL